MRAAVIREQQERYGRKVVAVLPVHYPKPLLTAMQVLAVELWGPPGPPRGPDAGRLQPYVCAVARNALAFLASGRADAVDAVLFPHTCDSIQGLATLAPDFGGLHRPALRFAHPKGDVRGSLLKFLKLELQHLSQALENLTGRSLEPEALRAALRLHRRIDAARRRLLEERRRVPLSDRELYQLLRRGEYLWPDDHLRELETALTSLGPAKAPPTAAVMITGYVPEPPGLLDALWASGAWVVADDYAAVGRRVPRAPAASAAVDPWDDLVAYVLSLPPCPTRASSQKDRLAYLDDLYTRSSAQAVLIHVQKFCEPELFDVPVIREHFDKRGVPVLYLEGEIETELSGQALTRIEAFVEMVASTRRVA
jgi:benzoyl-CoA reductase/2-hydroxyglutaryl-CoA dehydratase subunit BcrC/BadD/HgdB